MNEKVIITKQGNADLEKKLDELRARGMTNLQIIDQFMERAAEAHQKGIKLEDDLHKMS